jgi:protein TonB
MAGVEGQVVLSAIIEGDGSPHEIRVVNGLGFGLDEEAAKALSKWRFVPGRREGEPVPIRATVEIAFRRP